MTSMEIKRTMIAEMQSTKIQMQIEKEKAYPNGWAPPKISAAIGKVTRKINTLKRAIQNEQYERSNPRPSVKSEYKADGRKRTTHCPFCLRESDN